MNNEYDEAVKARSSKKRTLKQKKLVVKYDSIFKAFDYDNWIVKKKDILLLHHFSNCELNGRLEKEIDLENFFNRQTMLLDFVIRKYDKNEILNIDYQITF